MKVFSNNNNKNSKNKPIIIAKICRNKISCLTNVSNKFHVSKTPYLKLKKILKVKKCLYLLKINNMPMSEDEVAEWLRRWTANPLCFGFESLPRRVSFFQKKNI